MYLYGYVCVCVYVYILPFITYLTYIAFYLLNYLFIIIIIIIVIYLFGFWDGRCGCSVCSCLSTLCFEKKANKQSLKKKEKKREPHFCSIDLVLLFRNRSCHVFLAPCTINAFCTCRSQSAYICLCRS